MSEKRDFDWLTFIRWLAEQSQRGVGSGRKKGKRKKKSEQDKEGAK